MSVILLPEARLEAVDAAHWYERKQSGLAERFFIELEQALDAVESSSESFPRVETNKTRRNLRRHLLESFPYAIAFEVAQDEIIVIAVAHTSRRPNYWARRNAPD